MNSTRAWVVAAAAAVVLVPVLASCGGEAPGELTSQRTVFMGDSITQADTPSFDEPPGPGSWVGYATADPGSPWTYLANVALGGQTLGEMAARFESDVLSRNPDGVVIMGGTNDLFRGVPLGSSMASLRTMIEQAEAAGALVWVVGPPPINASYGSLDPMATAQAAVALITGATYVDVGDDLLGADGNWPTELSSDGVHLTPAGAAALADLVLDGLRE